MPARHLSEGRKASAGVSPKPRAGFGLRLFLLVPFISVIVAAVGTIGWISYRNGQRSVEELSHRLLSEINARIADHLADFLRIPQLANGQTADAISRGTLDPRDQQALEGHFLQQIRAFESVSSTYFGNTAGGLSDAGREGGAGSLYVMETDAFAAGRLSKRTVDSEGRPTALLLTVASFDARTRPWYTGALRKGDVSWTDPYVLSTGQDMAISTSQPVFDASGTLVGVVSADIFLAQLGAFLKSLPVGSAGYCFIMEPTGLLIASSEEESPFTRRAGSEALERLEARLSSSPAIRAAAEAIARRFADLGSLAGSQRLVTRLEGAAQLIEASPFTVADGLHWIVVSVVPESDFMARIDANARATLIAIVTTLVLAVGIGIAMARLISGPVLRLNESTKATIDGAWGDLVPERAPIAELRELASSFNRMLARLRTAMASLTAEIDERRQAEAAARVSAEKYRILFESFPAGVMVTDADGRILEVNSKAESLLELEAGEAPGRPLQEIGRRIVGLDGAPVPPDQLVSVRALREGRLVQGVASGVLRRSGSIVWLDVSAAPIPLPGYGVAVVLADITEMRTTEAALQAALREVKQLSGLIPICSHCKRIRDDRGYWHEVEAYISDHTDVGFSHSYCPECIEKYYPEYRNRP